MELFVDGSKIGHFKTLNECYKMFDCVRAHDWIIIKNGYVIDKK